ncbi:hypothetical protein N2152v2_000473 [Parachlorella kessleri]
METSSSFMGLSAIRESWARTVSLGTPQQTGSYVPHNPFLYFLNKGELTSTGGNQLVTPLPNLVADTLTATLLSRVANKAAGQAYLWSPFAILACVSGSAAPLHNLLVLLATFAAVRGRPLLAGAALASAAQLSLTSLTFAVPLLAALCLPPGAVQGTSRQGSAPLQPGKRGEQADRATAGQQASCQAPEQGSDADSRVTAELQHPEQEAAGYMETRHNVDTNGEHLEKRMHSQGTSEPGKGSSRRDSGEVKGVGQAWVSDRQSSATAVPATQATGHWGSSDGGGANTTRAVSRCAMFAASLAGATALLLLAEGAVVTVWAPAPPRGAPNRAQQGLLQRAAVAAGPEGAAGVAIRRPGISAGLQPPTFGWVRRGEQPAVAAAAAAPASWLGAACGPWRLAVQRWSERLRSLVLAEELHPNLGLQWYFFAEVFPRFRPFFLYWFAVAPVAMSLPLALRFPREPLLCLLCQAITNCLLGPHPTYGDIALWLGLLPVAAPQLATMRGKGWWAVSFLAILTLNTAAYQLWWVRGVVNANFLYGANLAWAAWQVLFLVQLVKAAARLQVSEQHAQHRQ